jgi:hypothetical protein
MIQRIQTIFLLSSTALMAILFFYPFAEISVGEQILSFRVSGFYTITPEGNELVKNIISIPLIISIILVINLLAIFLFKKRKLQMRFTIYNILLMTGTVGVVYFLLLNSFELKPSISYNITFVFPIIAAIFNYMAFRNIRKDELLVRAVDRIR